MQDAIGDYINSLAAEANQLRQQHGGVRRWWLEHDSENCVFCGNKRVGVRITDTNILMRRRRTDFKRNNYEPGRSGSTI